MEKTFSPNCNVIAFIFFGIIGSAGRSLAYSNYTKLTVRILGLRLANENMAAKRLYAQKSWGKISSRSMCRRKILSRLSFGCTIASKWWLIIRQRQFDRKSLSQRGILVRKPFYHLKAFYFISLGRDRLGRQWTSYTIPLPNRLFYLYIYSAHWI